MDEVLLDRGVDVGQEKDTTALMLPCKKVHDIVVEKCDKKSCMDIVELLMSVSNVDSEMFILNLNSLENIILTAYEQNYI